MTRTWTTNPYEGDQRQPGVFNAGCKALGILRLASNVADTETVTIGADVYEFNSTGGVTAGRIAVDVSSAQTPAVACPALVAAINTSGTEPVSALRITDNEILLTSDQDFGYTIALAETMAGTNNAWDTSAMRGGNDQTLREQVVAVRVPNATEVALGNLHIPVSFVPIGAIVQVRVTATGVEKAWDGGMTVDTANRKITLDNAGTTDWAATDTIYAVIFGNS